MTWYRLRISIRAIDISDKVHCMSYKRLLPRIKNLPSPLFPPGTETVDLQATERLGARIQIRLWMAPYDWILSGIVPRNDIQCSARRTLDCRKSAQSHRWTPRQILLPSKPQISQCL